MSSLPELEWKPNGVPVATRFDDPYFSLEDGLAETRHVFLQGNDLPARFVRGFAIAELGFGTGLNYCAALRAWRTAGMAGPLRYTAFERYPMSPADMARALAHFPDLAAEAAALVEGDTPGLQIIPGDARQTLLQWGGAADAWFLDGFSPAKNPELWEPALMKAVYDRTAQGGTAATYTAAGFVRRGLEAAGFTVTRAPGFGRKRHMTRAVR
ncbi:MAG: tRNA (5-methylaminomethyl-2-thiouridine)(34)-methyltransferase MnmD [Pseudomonadota bacterium]